MQRRFVVVRNLLNEHHEVKAKSFPNCKGKERGDIPNGATVPLIDETDDWWCVEYKEIHNEVREKTTEGWIKKRHGTVKTVEGVEINKHEGVETKFEGVETNKQEGAKRRKLDSNTHSNPSSSKEGEVGNTAAAEKNVGHPMCVQAEECIGKPDSALWRHILPEHLDDILESTYCFECASFFARRSKGLMFYPERS